MKFFFKDWKEIFSKLQGKKGWVMQFDNSVEREDFIDEIDGILDIEVE